MRITHWGQRLSTDETDEILWELASAHAHALSKACPHRERVNRLIDDRSILGVCGLELAYPDLTAMDAIHLRQIRAFFEKRSDIVIPGIDRRAVARQKFREAEELNRQTNEIFRLREEGLFCFAPPVERVFYAAQRKISRILGDVPEFDDLKFRFGPGATTQVKRRIASARRKLSQTFACSEDLIPLVRDVLEAVPSWLPDGDREGRSSVPVEIHDGKLVFVRKNYKTDRSVVVEPFLNGFVQLGICDFLSDRLRRSGIDISDQRPNQVLAREGSITGALATLDLSSASDTIASGLVIELLPFDWYDFLSYFRTGRVRDGDSTIELQMFSSMGNGFTFPLETLIFYALAKAAVEEKGDDGTVRAFGDDIIVPSNSFDFVVEVLRCAGFIPNITKSFSSGPFRESCGADYLSGINIRPCYQKQALVGADLFKLHNFYVRNGQDSFASLVLKFIDPSIQRWGPDGFGDGHLVRDGKSVPFKRDKGWAGYTFESYSWRGRKDFTVLPGDYLYPSYSIYASSGSHESFTEHDRAGRFGVSTSGVRGVKLIKINIRPC